MRKIVAIFIAIFLLHIGAPISSSAKKKAKTHKSYGQRKAEKKQKKKWEKIRSRSNDYREKRDEHVGDHMLGKQPTAEQKARRKHHLKPDGSTYK